MEEVFKSFCAFGQKGAAPMMDGYKFAKMSRDCKLFDKNLTSIDVDIIFSTVKNKAERKINYKQFQEALKFMAEKKYPAQEDSLAKLEAKIIEGKGPRVGTATKVVNSEAVNRLTDASKYTGSHKERFDESGKGKGIAGRKDGGGDGYVGGYKGKDSYDKTH